jgi:formylglycine-generating enzyme required for sulfatase activity
MKNYLKIILFLIVPQCLAFTQQITNLHQKIENGRIVITYDLPGKIYEIYDIKLTAENEFEIISPQIIDGDLQDVSPGNNKVILWEPVLENRRLEGWHVNLIVERKLFNMTFISGGTFERGCWVRTGECKDDEKPVHAVTVSSYYMSTTEVTQDQWKSVMNNNPSVFKGDDLPVENISWNVIQEFLNKLYQQTGEKYRLPTEAEWEYAARSGGASTGSATEYKYAGTNSNFGDYAWYDENSNDKTHPVAQRKPNGLGLYDMSGNVQEWCSDIYDKSYYKNSPAKDPKGAKSGSSCVLRGGSWFMNVAFCRLSNRNFNFPQSRYNDIGFRLAMDKK